MKRNNAVVNISTFFFINSIKIYFFNEAGFHLGFITT